MLFKTKNIYLIIILLVLHSSAYCQTVWKMTALAWGPYVDENAKNCGRSTQILSELLADKNIKLVVDFFPWERAKIKARNREYVGYFPAWPEEVQKGFIASSPIDWSQISIMKRTGFHLEYENIESLFKNHKVGIVSTYIYPEEISRYIKMYSHNVDEAPNEISLLKKLVRGRNDAAITDPLVMKYYSNILNISGFETVDVIMRKELVVAMRDDEENRDKIILLESVLKIINQ